MSDYVGPEDDTWAEPEDGSLMHDANPAAGAEDKGCPACGAPPGDFCHTPTGKPRSDHRAREYAGPAAEES